MRYIQRWIVFAVILSSLIGHSFLSGCATTPKKTSLPPEWAEKQAGAFVDKEGKLFYGVGAVNGMKNKPLATTAADNRARAEIAKVFETYVASLMRDYSASTTAGDFSRNTEEQHIEQAIKTFSSATLSGVIIVDHWTDPNDGTLYSLARLDLEKFRQNLDQMKELSAEVREFVRRNAEKSFEQLEIEEEKRR